MTDPLRYYPPSPALRPFVTNLFSWTGRNTAVHAWMPAIEAQIIVPIGGRVKVRFVDTASYRVDWPALVGPMAGSMHTETSDDFIATGAGFTLAGYRALIEAPATRLVNRVTELAAIWGAAPVGDMAAHILSHDDPDARAALLDRWLCHRLARTADRRDERPLVVDKWLAGSNVGAIGVLADTLGLSTRQTERLVAGLSGMTPKTLAMRQRALIAADRLAAAPDSPIASIAYGYTDHSHLLRDFRRFIGSTPSRFLQTDAMMHVFVEPARMGTKLMLHLDE